MRAGGDEANSEGAASGGRMMSKDEASVLSALLHNRELPFGRGGSKGEDDVWDWLQRVAVEFDALRTTNAKLVTRVQQLERMTGGVDTLGDEEFLAELPNRMQRALRSAQHVGQEMVEQARNREAALLEQAAEEAVEICQKAQVQAQDILQRAADDARTQLEEVQRRGEEIAARTKAQRSRMIAELDARRISMDGESERLEAGRTYLRQVFATVKEALEEPVRAVVDGEQAAPPADPSPRPNAPPTSSSPSQRGPRTPSRRTSSARRDGRDSCRAARRPGTRARLEGQRPFRLRYQPLRLAGGGVAAGTAVDRARGARRRSLRRPPAARRPPSRACPAGAPCSWARAGRPQERFPERTASRRGRPGARDGEPALTGRSPSRSSRLALHLYSERTGLLRPRRRRSAPRRAPQRLLARVHKARTQTKTGTQGEGGESGDYVSDQMGYSYDTCEWMTDELSRVIDRMVAFLWPVPVVSGGARVFDDALT